MKYKLLQSIPGAQGGAIFEKKPYGYVHQIDPKNYIGFPAWVVEYNIFWFERI